MDRVIDALRIMARDGGLWDGGSIDGVWSLDLAYGRVEAGFTQSDLRDFLAHYDGLLGGPG